MNVNDHHRTLLGAALVLGIGAFSIGDILRRTLEPVDPSTAALTAAIHDRPGLWVAAGLLEVLAALLLVPGAIGARRLVAGRGARTTRIGAGLLVVGAIASMGHAVGYFGTYASYAASGLDASALAKLEGTNDLLGGVVIALFMIGLMIGPLVLTIGLRRASAVPVWVPALALVFVVAGVVSGPLAGVVGLVAALGSLGYVGVRVMRADVSLPAGASSAPSMA
ncbi:MAG: hypothetical protein ABIZ07_03255 [Dermatophilaceae bacterium]